MAAKFPFLPDDHNGTIDVAEINSAEDICVLKQHCVVKVRVSKIIFTIYCAVTARSAGPVSDYISLVACPAPSHRSRPVQSRQALVTYTRPAGHTVSVARVPF